jgi:regulator of replication initiation timing
LKASTEARPISSMYIKRVIQFNETQRERVITEHLVEEVALLQDKRMGIQEQSKNLKHHQETLLEENARIQMENRELKSFFTGPTGEEEQRLASRMKARIEELRDNIA